MPIPRHRPTLTPAHVSRIHRQIEDPGPQLVEGFRPATDTDFAENVSEIMRTMPARDFWLFGYGSLIWKPETSFVEKRKAVARGWRRNFCLGWDYRYRGSRETPGLMMALDRGGQCTGMAYRLPAEALEEELHKLIRREVSMVPTAFPWRWIKLDTNNGKLDALTFAMNRKSPRYVSGLSEDQMVDMFATACGFRGTMAEYLLATVSKLEELDMRDHHLWRLQALVADRIDATRDTEA